MKSRESTSISAKIFASGGRYPSETTVRGHQTDQTIDTGLVLLVNLYLYEWYIVSKFISLVFIIYNSVSICKQLLTSEFWSIYSLNTAAAPSEEFRTKQPIIFQECRNLLSLLGIPLISVCAHILLHLYISGFNGARWSEAFHYRYKPFITSRKLALTSKLSLATFKFFPIPRLLMGGEIQGPRPSGRRPVGDADQWTHCECDWQWPRASIMCWKCVRFWDPLAQIAIF